MLLPNTRCHLLLSRLLTAVAVNFSCGAEDVFAICLLSIFVLFFCICDVNYLFLDASNYMSHKAERSFRNPHHHCVELCNFFWYYCNHACIVCLMRDVCETVCTLRYQRTTIGFNVVAGDMSVLLPWRKTM